LFGSVVGGITWYCGISGLMGSSVTESSLGVPRPTEGEGSWAAEAEVLELLVALTAASARISQQEQEQERPPISPRDSKHTTGSIAADTDVSVLETTESV
jgi:hypothetical protein